MYVPPGADLAPMSSASGATFFSISLPMVAELAAQQASEASQNVLPNSSLHLKAQGKEQTWSDLLHLARAQSRDERTDFSFRNGLKMIQVNGAVSRHAFCLSQQDLGRNVPNSRRDRGHGHFSQKLQC
jgi:hypothetical protein